jgi:hypothetical protein
MDVLMLRRGLGESSANARRYFVGLAFPAVDLGSG